jgi:peptidoglycan/LPS O-acetylase OafA/YrhL
LWLALLQVLSFLLAPENLVPPFSQLWRGILGFSERTQPDGALVLVCRQPRRAALRGLLLLFGHYWHLSLEEQFYLVLLVVLVLVPRRFLVPCALLGIAVMLFTPRPLFSLGAQFRVEGFLWGIVIALLRGGVLMRFIESLFLVNLLLRVTVKSLLEFTLGRLPVFFLTHRASGQLPVVMDPLVVNLVVAVAITVLLAQLNYRFVEVPLRERGRTVAARWR